MVRLGGEVEGRLLGVPEKGGVGNSHCRASVVSRWQWKWQRTAAASWLNNIKNFRPAAGQLVCELAGGQTTPASYLGAILSYRDQLLGYIVHY